MCTQHQGELVCFCCLLSLLLGAKERKAEKANTFSFAAAALSSFIRNERIIEDQETCWRFSYTLHMLSATCLKIEKRFLFCKPYIIPLLTFWATSSELNLQNFFIIAKLKQKVILFFTKNIIQRWIVMAAIKTKHLRRPSPTFFFLHNQCTIRLRLG